MLLSLADGLRSPTCLLGVVQQAWTSWADSGDWLGAQRSSNKERGSSGHKMGPDGLSLTGEARWFVRYGVIIGAVIDGLVVAVVCTEYSTVVVVILLSYGLRSKIVCGSPVF